MCAGIQGHQDVGFTALGYRGGPSKEKGFAFPCKMDVSGLGGRSLKGERLERRSKCNQNCREREANPTERPNPGRQEALSLIAQGPLT